MTTIDLSRLVTILIDYVSSFVFIWIITSRIKWCIFPFNYVVKLTNISKEFKEDNVSDIRKLFEEKYGKYHEITEIKEIGDILYYQIQFFDFQRWLDILKLKI